MSKDNYAYADYEAARDKYAAEAKTRWGHTDTYKESKRKEAGRTEAESVEMMTVSNEIMTAFARSMDRAPSAPEVQALVKRWQAFITASHYNCTDEILEGLAEMYISDERFTENIDRFGDGTARFMYEAIKAYCGT